MPANGPAVGTSGDEPDASAVQPQLQQKQATAAAAATAVAGEAASTMAGAWVKNSELRTWNSALLSSEFWVLDDSAHFCLHRSSFGRFDRDPVVGRVIFHQKLFWGWDGYP